MRMLHAQQIAEDLLTGEAAKIAEVSPETIRLWERNGLLKARRTAGGTRIFSRTDVIRVTQERAKS
jgi:DNA-binding transcriptional MerR regulator